MSTRSKKCQRLQQDCVAKPGGTSSVRWQPSGVGWDRWVAAPHVCVVLATASVTDSTPHNKPFSCQHTSNNTSANQLTDVSTSVGKFKVDNNSLSRCEEDVVIDFCIWWLCGYLGDSLFTVGSSPLISRRHTMFPLVVGLVHAGLLFLPVFPSTPGRCNRNMSVGVW